MSKEFYEVVYCNGLATGYLSLVEADFAATAGLAYTPPERGDFRRIVSSRQLQLLQDSPGVIETFQTTAATVRLPGSTLDINTDDAKRGRIFWFKNSGTNSITVQDYLGSNLWVVRQYAIVLIVGNDNNNWDFYFTAKNIDFNNSTNNFIASETQSAIEEARTKAGAIASGSFSGNPKKAVVTFSPAFPDNNYSVSIVGENTRVWSIESKSASGFTINANANQVLTTSVYWSATRNWS